MDFEKLLRKEFQQVLHEQSKKIIEDLTKDFETKLKSIRGELVIASANSLKVVVQEINPETINPQINIQIKL